jgi:hypothetical protein
LSVSSLFKTCADPLAQKYIRRLSPRSKALIRNGICVDGASPFGPIAHDISAKIAALIALTVGMVAVDPKRTWRQTQAGVAPNPNPCQLFPIAAHRRCRAFSRAWPRSQEAFAPCRRSPSQRKHIGQRFRAGQCQIPPDPRPSPAKQIQGRISAPFSLRPARLAKPRLRFLTSAIT